MSDNPVSQSENKLWKNAFALLQERHRKELFNFHGDCPLTKAQLEEPEYIKAYGAGLNAASAKASSWARECGGGSGSGGEGYQNLANAILLIDPEKGY